jgi:hypothetical protein
LAVVWSSWLLVELSWLATLAAVLTTTLRWAWSAGRAASCCTWLKKSLSAAPTPPEPAESCASTCCRLVSWVATSCDS